MVFVRENPRLELRYSIGRNRCHGMPKISTSILFRRVPWPDKIIFLPCGRCLKFEIFLHTDNDHRLRLDENLFEAVGNLGPRCFMALRLVPKVPGVCFGASMYLKPSAEIAYRR